MEVRHFEKLTDFLTVESTSNHPKCKSLQLSIKRPLIFDKIAAPRLAGRGASDPSRAASEFNSCLISVKAGRDEWPNMDITKEGAIGVFRGL